MYVIPNRIRPELHARVECREHISSTRVEGIVIGRTFSTPAYFDVRLGDGRTLYNIPEAHILTAQA